MMKRLMIEKIRGKRSASHRYNLLPLLPSGPDGVERELVVQDLPHTHQRKRLNEYSV